MKQKKWMELASLMTLTVFLAATALSCGGGGGSSGPGTITFTGAGQAGSAASDAKGSLELAQTLGDMANSMAGEGATQAGYSAPNKGGAAGGDAIAGIDPKLRKLVDKMVAQLQNPSVSKAKARAKANMKTVSGTVNCDSGWLDITGTDNSDDAGRTFDEATVTISFTACRDNALFTEVSGGMQLYWKRTPESPDPITAATANVIVNNFVFKQYDTSFINVLEQGSMNGTFNSTYNGTSGSDYANGTFEFTDYVEGFSATLFFTGLSTEWTYETDIDSNEITTVTMNGSFGFDVSSNYGDVNLTITLGSLEDKWRMNVSDSSLDNWLNGSITVIWTPMLCASGTINFTTDELTPMHYPVGYTCPVSGTLQVNNATIVFGSPIFVTINGINIPYTNCYDMEQAGDGMCM